VTSHLHRVFLNLIVEFAAEEEQELIGYYGIITQFE
jgi:hypothetical protein